MMLAKGPKVNKIPRSNGSAPPPIHSGNTSAMTSNFDDVPLPKGVGAEGGPATFEELLLRSLAKEGGSQSGGIGGQTRSMPRPTATQHSPISKSAQRPSLPAQMTRTSSASSNEPENRLSMSFQSVRSSSEYDDSSRVSYEAKDQMKPLPFTSPEAARTQQPRAYELIGSRLDQTQDEELEEFQHLEQQLMNESAIGRQVLMQQPATQRPSSATHSSAASFQRAGQHMENSTTLRSFNLGSLDVDDGAAEPFERAAVRATSAASSLSSSTRRPATAAPSMRSHASAAPAIRTAASAPIDSASSDDEGSAAPGSDLVSKMWGKQSRKALQGQVAALKEQIAAANAQRKELEQRCLSLEDDAASVKAELMRAKRAVRDLEQQREQLSSNREDVASLVAAARKEIEAEKIAEVRKAKKLQEAAEHRARVSDIAVGELKQQVQTLSAQLDEVKGSSRERESRLKGNADSLKSQVEVLRQRNEDLQQQLQIAESQLLAGTHYAASKSAASASAAARSGARHAEPAAAAPSSPMKTNGKSAPLGLQDSFRPNSSQGMSNVDESRGQSLRPSSAINTAMNELPAKLEQQSHQDDEQREIVHSDGKRELHRRDGSKTILFPSGHRKEIRTDGSTEVFFGNGDVKKTLADGVVVYTYGETKTIHTTHPSGLSVIEFPNGQVEKHLPDGSQEIVFPDQTFKYISPGGEEQAVFRNGTVITLFRDGRKETEFSNGQKETLFPDGTKERAYPDGSVRVLRVDGSTRSTYPDGSYRVKGAGQLPPVLLFVEAHAPRRCKWAGG